MSGKARVYLLDGAVLPFERPEQAPAQTIPGQLGQLGTDPGEITHVINSHYHFGQAGGNKYCTRAVTLAHAELFFSHDAKSFRLWPKAPASYA